MEPSATPATPLWLRAAPVIFLLLWSGGFAVAKVGLEHAGPLTFLAARYVLVLVVLLPLVVVLRPPLPATRRGFLDLVVVGFLIQVVYFGLSYAAFDLGVSAGGLALVVSLQPVLVSLLAPAVAAETVGRLRWLGLALGLLGAALVIVGRSEVEATSVSGMLAGVGALAGMTTATLYEKRFGVANHPVTANAVQYAVGAACTVPLALAVERLEIEWAPGLAAALAYLVIGNSLIAITLLLAMVRRGEASRVSALFFLVPPLAALIAWAVVGEHMPAIAWLGMAVAALGVALATRAPGAGRALPLRPGRRRSPRP